MVIGEVNLLRAAAVLALVVVVVVAVLFDYELVRDRRAHGLDRANLARAYAVEYAGWIAEQRALARTAPPAAVRLETTTVTVSGRGPAIVASDEPADLWDDIADAPTVVDLVAWEERLRESTGASAGSRGGPVAAAEPAEAELAEGELVEGELAEVELAEVGEAEADAAEVGVTELGTVAAADDTASEVVAEDAEAEDADAAVVVDDRKLA